MKFMKMFLMSMVTAAFSSMALADAAKPTIVLVHGAFQTANCWQKVKPLLEAKGYTVVPVDLPGRDNDQTPVDQINLNLYRDKVLGVVNAQSNPVVLVGHSFGGMTISNVAEAAPGKVKSLVYLSAFLPQSGQSTMGLAQADTDSLLSKSGNLVISKDGKYVSIADAQKQAIFANDAQGADVQLIVNSLIPEPLSPWAEAVSLTPSNFGAVHKFYVMTLKDQAISPAAQQRMVSATAVDKVIKIDAGHASYITQPDQVVSAIDEAAQ